MASAQNASEYSSEYCNLAMEEISHTFSRHKEFYKTDFAHTINHLLSRDEREKFILAFDKCNCCERHKINRPQRFGSWLELPFNGTQDTPCDCKCRHASRFICRTYNLGPWEDPTKPIAITPPDSPINQD